MPNNSTYAGTKTWEVICFFAESLFVGILLIGYIYIMEKFIFANSKENEGADFIEYIFKAILYIALMFLLSTIFEYQYLYIGILLVVLLFFLSLYSISIGIERIRICLFAKKAHAAF